MNDLDATLRRGGRPNVSTFLPMVSRARHGECAAALVAQAIRTRAELGELPWLSDYLDDRLAPHVPEVCRQVGHSLFRGSGELADRLGVREFGDYVATDLIGFGGFGTVFKGRHRKDRSGGPVAIKLAHPGSDAAARAIGYEMDALTRLAGFHHVPKLRATDANPKGIGGPYIVMDFVDGEPLLRWQERHGPPGALLLGVCRQIVQVFCDLHGFDGGRFNHGDVSPANILVAGGRSRPVVTLVDFGSAVVKVMPNPFRCATARYAAPEVLRREVAAPSIATDLWGLGVVISELFGAYPFGDEIGTDISMSDEELGDWIASGTRVELPNALGPRFIELVKMCLDPDPSFRRQLVSAPLLLHSIPAASEYLPRIDAHARSARAVGPRWPLLVRLRQKSADWAERLGLAVICGTVISLMVLLGIDKIRPPHVFPSATQTTTEGKDAQRVNKLSQDAIAAAASKEVDIEARLIKEQLEIIEGTNSGDAPASWVELRRAAIYNLARIAVATGKWDEAEARFRKLFLICPEVCNWRGVAMASMGDLARVRYERARDASQREAAIKFYVEAEAIFRSPSINNVGVADSVAKRLKLAREGWP